MRRDRPRLGELLEGRGELTREQLLRALRNQKVVGGKLGTCLLEIDAVPEDALLQALAEQQGAGAAGADDLRGVPDVVLQLVPNKVARRLIAVPFKASGTQARIAVLDATDLAVMDELSFVTGRRVHLFVTTEARLFEALERYYGEPSSPRIAKLIDRLNRNRFLWRADAPRDDSPGAPTALRDESADRAAGTGTEFLPSFQSAAGLELPRIDLPGPAAGSPQPAPALPAAAMVTPPAAPATNPAPAADLEPMAERTPEPPDAPRTTRAPKPAPPPVAATDGGDEAGGDDEATGEVQVVTDRPAPTLEEAEARLLDPADRDDVGATLLDFARSRGRHAMLFKVLPTEIAGWLCGPGCDPERLSAFRLPRNRPSLFHSLLHGAPLHRGPLSELKADARLLALRPPGNPATDVLLLPVRIRERTVGILYLEPSGAVFDPVAVADLQRLTAKAAIALELCILRAKLARG